MLIVKPLRVRPPETCGAGAITLAGRLGALRDECSPSVSGAPGIARAGAALRASRLATAWFDAGIFKLGASTIFPLKSRPRATWMV